MWNKRIQIDPEQNRKSLMPVVILVIVVALACGMGVYFGLFMGLRLGG